ncbi:alpha/beta hydrolase [Mycobacteroides abscessus]|uniref:Alpha/beta hydrolase n=2 Tax=Mycobacteroides abscessus TaxID=36809 RepID=A0ABD7HGL9_9MYCO|nr:alpha/beta hydrolase [Mycobacteroides abscessus]AWG66423.1 alpha/beta hydrolase [Mycobacteroides abscessus]MBN7441344.1 alpha/beta hydrolase fold domain-containing protein [Mycobacteroides abscessus subsp. abscessus]NOS00055.1 alpha/beta hydrolase [Mycobacteroides abscessus]PVA20696.1 alpha/beta hydrolase [Mycobacteroides abscessus]PVA35913.1 alpha/beta hydrolase [Mycobacteroides abscessus]
MALLDKWNTPAWAHDEQHLQPAVSAISTGSLQVSYMYGRSLRAGALSWLFRVVVKPVAAICGHLLAWPWPFALIEGLAAIMPRPRGVTIEAVEIAGLSAELICPKHGGGNERTSVVLYLHGGAFYLCGRNTHRRAAAHLVRLSQQPALVVEYRQAPRHPVSQSVRDCVSAFGWLRQQGYPASSISIAGDSAGGFLAVATALAAMKEKLGTPAALVCWSPGLDFTLDNARRNRPSDPFIPRAAYNALCRRLAKLEPANQDDGTICSTTSMLSIDTGGFPPTLIQVGAQEFLAEDSIRFARKLADGAVPTVLELWDRQLHVFPVFADLLPEGKQALRRAAAFLREACPDTN